MIYALVDEYGTPRYVGQTTKTLTVRLSQHRSAERAVSFAPLSLARD